MSVHSTQSSHALDLTVPSTGAVCDNLLIACQIQMHSDKVEILEPCYLCHDRAVLVIFYHGRAWYVIANIPCDFIEIKIHSQLVEVHNSSPTKLIIRVLSYQKC